MQDNHDASRVVLLPRSAIIIRNVAVNSIGHALLLILGLAVIPVLIHRLGLAAFAVLAVVNTVTALAGLLDMGLGASVVREIAGAAARGDREREARVLASAAASYLVQGLIGTLLLVFAAPLLLAVFDLPVGLRAEAITALRIAGAGFGVRLALAPYSAVPVGLQRFDVITTRRVAATALGLLAQVGLATRGANLTSLVAAALAFQIAGDVGVFCWSRRRIAAPGRVDLSLVRAMWSFGFMKLLTHIASLGMYHGDKLIIGAFLPIEAVAHFSVPHDGIAQRLDDLRGNITSAYYPAACAVLVGGDVERARRLYIAANRYLALASLPLAGGLAALAHPLLATWIDPDMAAAAAPTLVLLALSGAIAAIASLPAIAADAAGRPKLAAAFSVASTLFHLALAVVLVPRLGVVGAAWATLASRLVFVPAFVGLVNRRIIGLGAREYLGRCLLRPFLAAMAMAGVVSWLASGVTGWVSLLGLVLVGSAVYTALVVATGSVDRGDWQLLRQLVVPGGAKEEISA